MPATDPVQAASGVEKPSKSDLGSSCFSPDLGLPRFDTPAKNCPFSHGKAAESKALRKGESQSEIVRAMKRLVSSPFGCFRHRRYSLTPAADHLLNLPKRRRYAPSNKWQEVVPGVTAPTSRSDETAAAHSQVTSTSADTTTASQSDETASGARIRRRTRLSKGRVNGDFRNISVTKNYLSDL